MLRYGKEVLLANGQKVPVRFRFIVSLHMIAHDHTRARAPGTTNMQLSRELLDKLVKRVVQKVKANKLDVPFNAHTKIPLDVAVHIVYQLVTSPQPADYFTVFATRYLLAPFQLDLMEVERLGNVDRFPFLRMDNLMKGAELLFISNESFAPASNLLKETYPIFVPHSFGSEGQIYDGWETVRHNMYPPGTPPWLPATTHTTRRTHTRARARATRRHDTHVICCRPDLPFELSSLFACWVCPACCVLCGKRKIS